MEYGGSGRAGEIRGLVTTHLPGYQIRSVALLGEGCRAALDWLFPA
jgi:hypothetical protein